MQKIFKEIIGKDCFLAKKPCRERIQRRRDKAERGGALNRAGTHIRDNKVTLAQTAFGFCFWCSSGSSAQSL